MTELWTGCSTCETEKCNVNLALVLTCPQLATFECMPVQGCFFEMLPEICRAKKEAEDGYSAGTLNCLTYISVWLYKHICTGCFNSF